MHILKFLKKLHFIIDIEVIETRLPQPETPWGRLDLPVRLADVGQLNHIFNASVIE